MKILPTRDDLMKRMKWLLATVIGGGGATLFYTVEPEIANQILGKASQSDLTEWLIVVGVVWATMGRKVSESFSKMKGEFKEEIHSGFAAVTAELKAFKDVVAKQSARLDTGDTILKDHEERITTLEQRSHT